VPTGTAARRLSPWAGGLVLAAALAAATALWTPIASGVSRDEALMPIDQYTTPKSRTLATTYRPQMLELYQHLYHCVPWVEVQKGGIGFRSPKGATADERYLTTWIWIEQGDDPGFAAMRPQQRASAMFSRYGVPLLRRMAALGGVSSDADVDGFATVLSWVKPGRARPTVNETLVSFVDRASLNEFRATTGSSLKSGICAPMRSASRAWFLSADCGRST